MIKKVINRVLNKRKSIYIAETQIRFNGEKYYEDIIETQITNKETVIGLGRGIELVFENGKPSKAYQYYEEMKGLTVYSRIKERELQSDETQYKLPVFKINYILKFHENPNGFHQLGGDFSDEFKCPSNNCCIPFQYLGFINNEDDNFKWLPFKIHLTCPLYLNFEEIFLDYSDHTFPVILNLEDVETCETSFNEVKKDSVIIFEEQRFDFKKSVEYSGNIDSGMPNWMQGQYIPTCPKSGRKMKFLCQLHNGSKMKSSTIVPENDWNKNYFEELNFCGGDLYVFFEPISKVACYFIQYT
ncbi:hypothetical protein [Flavobacterium quisquiliarum]|uniref:Aldose 1-epimerase n=1 Tax=Flavobacterium quisquiliarum TaxID=1834436 RepID=A0ABV8WD02_9FLAO|nr:hypothetical protein [Flavobacterium quisquiliarum]MBW1658210.1 hypothetical protein [Flavobacterium quisquiliarum]NWL02262.1 hypothetical protein [Flavobacterium collinsii]